MKVNSFNLDPVPDSPYEQGNQDYLRTRLPDNLYLKSRYAVAPMFEKTFYYDTLLGHAGNIAAVKGFGLMDDLAGKSPITPELAKERYGVTIKEPTQESVVQYMYGRQKNTKSLEDKLSSVEDGFATGALMFGSGVAANLPEGIAFGIIFAPLMGAAATRFAQSSAALKFSPVAKAAQSLVSPGLSGYASRGALEEAIQTTIEAPVRAYSSDLVNEKYGVKEYGEDLAFSTVGGGIFGAIGYGVKNAWGRINQIKQSNPELKAKPMVNEGNLPGPVTSVSTYVGERSVYLNKNPEVVPTKLLENRLNTPKDTLGAYVFNKIPTENVKLTKYYNPHTIQSGDYGYGTQARFKEFFGDGVVLIDNNDLASSMAEAGTVIVADIDPNVKLYDLDAPPDKILLGKIREALGKVIDLEDLPDTIDSFLNKPLFDLYQDIKIASELDGTTAPLEAVNSVMRDFGFEGFTYTGRMGDSKFNGLFLFDPAKMVPREFNIAKVSRFGMRPEDINQLENFNKGLLDYRNDIDYEPDYDIMNSLPIEDNFEANYINSKIEAEIKTMGEELNSLQVISGIDNDVSMDEIIDIAANKVTKNYRGLEDLVDQIKSKLDSEVKKVSDTFGIPYGLVDQRKLIKEIKESMFKEGVREGMGIEERFLDQLSKEIDSLGDLFGVSPDMMNEDQVVRSARQKVLKSIKLETGYDKAREAAKALFSCEGL